MELVVCSVRITVRLARSRQRVFVSAVVFCLCCVFCQTLHRVPVVVPHCSSTSCVPFSLSHAALKEEQQQLSKRTQVSVMVPLDLTHELCNQIVLSLEKDEMAGTKHPSSDEKAWMKILRCFCLVLGRALTWEQAWVSVTEVCLFLVY